MCLFDQRRSEAAVRGCAAVSETGKRLLDTWINHLARSINQSLRYSDESGRNSEKSQSQGEEEMIKMLLYMSLDVERCRSGNFYHCSSICSSNFSSCHAKNNTERISTSLE
jgi:hypothetical protein